VDIRRGAFAPGAMLAGLWLAGWPCAFALDPALDISQYSHFTWRISDGFPKGHITSIVQTPDGYLWLGTDAGLLRFDGVQGVPWTPPAGGQLPDNNIGRLLVSRDGTLWIGTGKGLVSWKGGRLTRYPELPKLLIFSLLEDREGSVWAGFAAPNGGRLCAIRNGSVQCHGEDGRFGDGVISLYEYRGALWAAASSGLWRWKPGLPKVYPVPDARRAIHDLIEGDNGALWIAMNRGLGQLVDGRVQPYPLPAGGQFGALSLLRDRDGGLWIGTFGQGLLHVHQGKTDVFASADGLSGDNVPELFEDREGNIWAGTIAGLDRFRDFAVPTISVRQGFSSARLVSVLAARDGGMWIGADDGLNRWNQGQVTIYRRKSVRPQARAAGDVAGREIVDDGLPDNAVHSLFQDERGRVWVSTSRGVAWFEDGRFNPVSAVPATLVHSIAEERGGNLWISDHSLGLFHLLDGKLVEQVPWARLGHTDPAGTMAGNRARGGLWLGFPEGGVAWFKDGEVRASYTAAGGLGQGRVNELRLDPDGTLWAATEGGLSRLKDGHITTLASGNGLPCDAVHWLMEDDEHSYWLGTPCGLVRIARGEMDAWAADPKHTIQATVFDSTDGVKRFPMASGYSPHAAKSRDGRIWFPVYEGVSVVDPGRLRINKVPPPVEIERVIANRNEVTGRSRLPPLVRDLQIDYTALSFVAPEKVRFRYKLEGHDSEWTDAGTRRQAFYNDLPPRHYRFRVIACNNSGVWNEAGAALDFSIAPAYYQTTWFLAACAAAFLALLAGLYYLRMEYVKRQFKVRLEARVAERTRIARDFHDTLLQSFQGVLMRFSAVAWGIKDPPEAQEQLENIIEQARRAITEGRDAVQGLRSSTVVTNDLVRAISTLGEELTSGLAADQAGPCPEFRVRVEGTTRDLVPLVRDEVHRIGCEAVRNAFRHAQASRIEVAIHYDRRHLRLRVCDNGKGFDQSVMGEAGHPGHFGLPGMQERAKLAGGKLALLSRRDSGTEVVLTGVALILDI